MRSGQNRAPGGVLEIPFQHLFARRHGLAGDHGRGDLSRRADGGARDGGLEQDIPDDVLDVAQAKQGRGRPGDGTAGRRHPVGFVHRLLVGKVPPPGVLVGRDQFLGESHGPAADNAARRAADGGAPWPRRGAKFRATRRAQGDTAQRGAGFGQAISDLTAKRAIHRGWYGLVRIERVASGEPPAFPAQVPGRVQGRLPHARAWIGRRFR